MVSIIIPVYNEEKSISDCLKSINKQTFKDFEVIVVDDGSTDKTLKVLSEFPNSIRQLADQFPILILKQKHQGPGRARNLGVSKAKGEILVFVDADMTFDEDYIKNLIKPISDGKSKGTFSKDEYVSNWDNIYARCWNYFQGIKDKRRIPVNYPDRSPVFRAVLKKEFDKIGGFDPIGFTDDWTLSRKLGYQATLAWGAVCFHKNPDNLTEIYNQAVWIGKNEFISGNIVHKLYNLVRFNPLIQLFRSFILAIKFKELILPLFSVVYSSAVTHGILMTFFSRNRNK